MAKGNKFGRGGFPDRKHERLEQRKRFLIVCEGSKTEPNYFSGFPVPKELVDLEIIGYAQDPLNVIEYAVQLSARARSSKAPYDQVWGVFDRDDVDKQRFNEALALARREKIHVAYCNEAFELWYLLHFDYHNAGLSRTQYEGVLNRKLRKEDPTCRKYEKKDPKTYARLLKHQARAIQNATRLLAQYDPPRPYEDNPSTTVHLLVQELNKYARR